MNAGRSEPARAKRCQGAVGSTEVAASAFSKPARTPGSSAGPAAKVALDLAAPESMWQPAPDGSTPLLKRALAAVASGRRADAAFDLTLAGFLDHVRGLAASAGRV
ncbi:hypothetical protein ACIP4X_32870 [Streptomyces sp. NPDC088817]|uniref:hypothetical protein n=1 Tax=Streptomyces sp. NPDC088817 TaxID=3365907 RepID=UPI0038085958